MGEDPPDIKNELSHLLSGRCMQAGRGDRGPAGVDFPGEAAHILGWVAAMRGGKGREGGWDGPPRRVRVYPHSQQLLAALSKFSVMRPWFGTGVSQSIPLGFGSRSFGALSPSLASSLAPRSPPLFPFDSGHTKRAKMASTPTQPVLSAEHFWNPDRQSRRRLPSSPAAHGRRASQARWDDAREPARSGPWRAAV